MMPLPKSFGTPNRQCKLPRPILNQTKKQNAGLGIYAGGWTLARNPALRKERNQFWLVGQLRESRSAFCLRSFEFGQGVDRAGVRSIESKSMSAATTSNRLNGTARTEATNAESRMPNGIQGLNSDFASGTNASNEPDREWTNREIVDDAFNRGALGNAITPERLFIECRFRGLSDREVKTVLMEHEAVGFGDEGFKAAVSGDGQYFIQRIAAGDIENASMRELLAESADEIKQPKQDAPRLDIADAIRSRGIEISEQEAVVLEACHNVSKYFKSGGKIAVQSLKRVLVNYHREQFERRSDTSRAIERLVARKVLRKANNCIGLLEPLKPSPNVSRSQYARLADEIELEQVLVACDNCMPVGFKRRNVAQRKAVACLMEARHDITRKEVNRRIGKLIEAGILETAISKGASALRLTVEASSVMRAKASELTAARSYPDSDLIESTRGPESFNRSHDGNSSHIEAGRKGTSRNGTPAKSTAPRTDSKSIIQLLIQAIRLVERRA